MSITTQRRLNPAGPLACTQEIVFVAVPRVCEGNERMTIGQGIPSMASPNPGALGTVDMCAKPH